MSREFSEHFFTTNPQRCQRLIDLLMPHLEPQRPLRVLDVGCGSGELLLGLARNLPRASLTGVDVSAPNVEQGRDWAQRAGLSQRVQLTCADYLRYAPSAPFDLIVSDSALQYIAAPDEGALWSKLGSELAPGGLLAYSLPRKAPYNSALYALRRLMQTCRGARCDALILWAARLLHGRRLDEESLRQRVHYMYLLPLRQSEPALTAWVRRSLGLELVAEVDLPQDSLAQPLHRLTMLRRPKPS